MTRAPHAGICFGQLFLPRSCPQELKSELGRGKLRHSHPKISRICIPHGRTRGSSVYQCLCPGTSQLGFGNPGFRKHYIRFRNTNLLGARAVNELAVQCFRCFELCFSLFQLSSEIVAHDTKQQIPLFYQVSLNDSDLLHDTGCRRADRDRIV
jgi:hypothetical protein